MKNQYFGDVGDFGKYGMLSGMADSALSLGINWYLTEDDARTDGKFIDYLHRPEFQRCDEELHSFLSQSLKNDRRHINNLKRFARFKDTAAYDSVLRIDKITAFSEMGRMQRINYRNDWFARSLIQLDKCDLIFCDPDNGIETKSVNPAGKNSVKYINISEINQMLTLGKSVIVYNHRDRSSDRDYRARLQSIHRLLSVDTNLRILRFNRYSVRDYLFFILKEHSHEIVGKIDLFLNDNNWQRLFEECST